MMNKKIQDAMNDQLKLEMDSSILYLSMAAYFHSLGLDGMAHWMHIQSHEEFGHAMKFFNHIRDREGRVKIPGISEPKHEWASPLEAWQEAYRHEQFITSKINALAKGVMQEGDFPATPLLDWFHNEQIEEESQASKIAQMLERIGESGSGLVMLDRQLGKRES
jgi:ferritin